MKGLNCAASQATERGNGEVEKASAAGAEARLSFCDIYGPAEARLSFCDIYGPAEAVPLLQSPLQSSSSATCKVVPFQNAVYAARSMLQPHRNIKRGVNPERFCKSQSKGALVLRLEGD